MAAGNTNRSRARTVQVAFRLSPEDRDELRDRAADAGMSLQSYLEWKALDRPDAHDLPAGRPRHRQDSLPMTG